MSQPLVATRNAEKEEARSPLALRKRTCLYTILVERVRKLFDTLFNSQVVECVKEADS